MQVLVCLFFYQKRVNLCNPITHNWIFGGFWGYSEGDGLPQFSLISWPNPSGLFPSARCRSDSSGSRLSLETVRYVINYQTGPSHSSLPPCSMFCSHPLRVICQSMIPILELVWQYLSIINRVRSVDIYGRNRV